MIRSIKRVMLVDDNRIDNFFHERVVRKFDNTITVIATDSGIKALDYLLNTNEENDVDLIVLDVNMPEMTGWEFLEHYHKLNRQLQTATIVVMSSEQPNEKDKTLMNTMDLLFRKKPLTEQVLHDVLEHFSI